MNTKNCVYHYRNITSYIEHYVILCILVTFKTIMSSIVLDMVPIPHYPYNIADIIIITWVENEYEKVCTPTDTLKSIQRRGHNLHHQRTCRVANTNIDNDSNIFNLFKSVTKIYMVVMFRFMKGIMY